MERFSAIYPFTTENIAGYMSDIDLNDKKVITVTGSSDHIINIALKGAKDITTFDINPLTKYYMDLKISAIKELSYEEFLKIFLYSTKDTMSYDVINNLEMNNDSKEFWINNLRDIKLFNIKYFNPDSKLWQNLYLDKYNYEIVRKKLNQIRIKFINKNLKDLVLKDNYDYMFLSNISDYINKMYNENELSNYKDLIYNFLTKVNEIYFAYLYDIGNKNPRSDIDKVELVEELFGDIEKKEFKSALEPSDNKKDGVLILRRKENVRK